MAIAEHELTDPALQRGMDFSSIESQLSPEVIDDVTGLSLLHTELYGRARLNEDGSGTLTHDDGVDPPFDFAVGYLGNDRYFKLGDNGIPTLFYVIQGDQVIAHIGIGDSPLSRVGDVTNNSREISALAQITRRGK